MDKESLEKDISVLYLNEEIPLRAGKHHVSGNLNLPRHGNKVYCRVQPTGGPNPVPVQRAKTYTLSPLNHNSSIKKFTRFDFIGVGKLMLESTSYSTACYLDLMIIRMVANRRTG